MQSLPVDCPVHTSHITSNVTQYRIAWRDFGLSLVVPPGALPEGTSVRIAVHCCQTSTFRLPAGLQLVSLVYLVAASPEATFSKPVQLALKQPKKVTSDSMRSQLTFVVMDGTTAPEASTGAASGSSRELRPAQGGLFKIGSSTGRISLGSIDQLAVAIAQHRPGGGAHQGMVSWVVSSVLF